MANEQDWTVWEERRKSLNGTLDTLAGCYKPPPDGEPLAFPRQKALHRLVECLKTFGNEQFDYFYTGFHNGELQKSQHYPPEYVFEVVLDQIAHDLEVIQRATNQRISCPDGCDTSAMVDTLETSDRLACEALKSVIASGLVDEQTTAITYFHKSANIRVIPYAPVALIGIPFTCNSVDRDYLSIPHEVGHYVFWHGIEVGTNERIWDILLHKLPRKVPQNPPWCYEWVEDTFADICGCLIAGPVIALSSQDIARQHSQEGFTGDDEEHPVAMLRPHVYTKVLANKKPQPLSQQAQQLDTNWLNDRHQRVPKDEFEIHTGHKRDIDAAIGSKPVNDYTCIDNNKPVDKVIGKVLAIAGMNNIAPSWWSGYPQTTVNTLYEQFENYLANSPPVWDCPDSTECRDPESLRRDWLARGEKKWVEEWTEVKDKALDQGMSEADAVATANDQHPKWLSVLRAGGWASKIGSSENI